MLIYLKNKIFIYFQKIIPKSFLSYLFTKLAYSKNNIIKNVLIIFTIKYFKINLHDAIIKNVKDYSSFNDFFIRKINFESRVIQRNNNIIISPVDGTIMQAHKIYLGKMIQAKNKYFTVASLIANTKLINYTDFIVIYLSPKDYHRVHMPIDGTLTRMSYIPGKLFSVNAIMVNNINNLFSKNERLVCYFDTKIGEIAIVFIGAIFVRGIETVWHNFSIKKRIKEINHFNYKDNKLFFKKGEEIGLFNFGSTIIILFTENKICFNYRRDSIKMGESIAYIL